VCCMKMVSLLPTALERVGEAAKNVSRIGGHLLTHRSLRITHFSPASTALPSCSMQSLSYSELPLSSHDAMRGTNLPCLCSRAMPVSSEIDTGSSLCCFLAPFLLDGKLDG
jgi:hypothetical protein